MQSASAALADVERLTKEINLAETGNPGYRTADLQTEVKRADAFGKWLRRGEAGLEGIKPEKRDVAEGAPMLTTLESIPAWAILSRPGSLTASNRRPSGLPHSRKMVSFPSSEPELASPCRFPFPMTPINRPQSLAKQRQ